MQLKRLAVLVLYFMASSYTAQERSISCPKLYDAFISHRGPDVKHTLAKQLYDLLKAKNCRAFLDRQEIEGGDSIPAAITNSICSSDVQIAIFSKGYAQSSWCLDELVLMLEQIDKGALFIPVFYDVKPWELRDMENHNSQYAGAFSYYQTKGRNLDKLDAWKKALESAANIFGYEHSQPQGDCRDLCEKIVSRVVQEIQKRMPLIVAKYPVALDVLVQDFENSCPETSGLVGIFGLGGSGKTTLAKELFNRKRERYGASSFLFDVRESYANGQLHFLQKKLLKDLFHEKEEPKLTNVNEGTAVLKYRLAKANDCKFLIVLDDIDRHDQLGVLLPGLEGILSSGSLVIVTTRDQAVLTAADVIVRYQMKPLDWILSKELFCSYALRPHDSPTAYEKLVECFIKYCRGLPLSLIVLGAHVRGRGEHFWMLELEKVKKTPPQEIMQRLKISFDGLDREEKQIFIDIACFFNKRTFRGVPEGSVPLYVDIEPSKVSIQVGHKEVSYGETAPMSIWKMSDWNAEHAVETLQQKCLLQVVRKRYDWRFEMHDHLRDLGRQMADEFGPPRLWTPNSLRAMEAKGFKYILENTKARCFNSFRDSSIGAQIIYFKGSLNDSAEIELLWLEINGDKDYLKEIPSWIPLRKLHYLAIDWIEGLWKTNSEDSFQLRRLHIRNCLSLQLNQPELGRLERLNTLELESCYEWKTISGLSSLQGLQSLHVQRCISLETISDLSSLTGLQSLHVEGCFTLKTIIGLSSLTGLQSLHVGGCRLLETRLTLSSLTELRSLHMKGYTLSEEFDVANMRNLERISIIGCGQLQKVEGFQELQQLKHLTIDVRENGYAWVRNCVHALRRLPSECAILLGNAVEDAMDRLDVDLFSQVIGGATITEMETHVEIGGIMKTIRKVQMSSSSNAVAICAYLCECYYCPDFSRNRVMLTVVLPQRSHYDFEFEWTDDFMFGGRIMKGYKATVNEEEEGKALTLLQILVDRLYGERMENHGESLEKALLEKYFMKDS